MEREIQLHDNPPVMFSRGDDTHSGWRLRLTAPANRRALIRTPDSLGWSLATDPGRNTATIGCDTDRAYADVIWIGPETSHAFHTTLRGILSTCGGRGRGTGPGTPPWFRLDIVDGLVVVTPAEATAIPGQSVLYEAYTRRGEVAGEADRQPALVTWSAETSDVIFSAEEGGPALGEVQLTRSSVWVRASTIGAHTLTAIPADREQDALQATLRVSGVESITVTPGSWPEGRELPEQIHLAAGGFESPAHLGKVRIQLYPPIEGLSAHVEVRNGVGEHRSAHLSILDQLLYGDQGGFLFTSSGEGIIEGMLTTGDTLGDVEIQADHLTAMVRQSWVDPLDMATEWEARFEDRNGVLTDYAFINGGGKMHCRIPFLHRRIPGDPDSPVVPMDQHEIRLFVEEVVYMDVHGERQIITNTPSDPNPAVDELASFGQPVFTDSDGNATAVMNIADRVNLVSVKVTPYDFSVWLGGVQGIAPTGPEAMGPPQAAEPANSTNELDNRVQHPLYLVPYIVENNYAVIAKASIQIPVSLTSDEENPTESRDDIILYLGSTEISDWEFKIFDSNGQQIENNTVMIRRNRESATPHQQLFRTNLQSPG